MDIFEKQINIINENNYTYYNPINFDNFFNEPDSKKKILITVDDAFSSFYENGRDYLRNEIDDSDLIMRPKFVQGSEYINKWWKRKSIKRYTKLFNEGRLKPEMLYYSDILGMTWEQCKEKYLGEVGR